MSNESWLRYGQATASATDAGHITIRAKITGGVLPFRIEPGDWASGETNWLLDVIAPSRDAGTKVLANLSQVIGGPTLHIHPVVRRLVDVAALEEIGLVSSSGRQAYSLDRPEGAL